MTMSNRTRRRVGLRKGESSIEDDLGNALGVVSTVDSRVQLSKAEQDLLQSKALTMEDDPWNVLPNERRTNLLKPSYDPVQLIALCLQNNTLGQCIDALETNIDGTGYEIERRDGLTPEDLEADVPPVLAAKPSPFAAKPNPFAEKKPNPFAKAGEFDPAEAAMDAGIPDDDEEDEEGGEAPGEEDSDDDNIKALKQFFDEAFINESFTSIRRKLRRDRVMTGNAYLEVIRSQSGEITLVNHVDAKLVRLVKLDDPVMVTKKIMRNGTEQTVQMLVRERRYAQLIGNKVRYFREFGSSREVNADTGEWMGPAKQAPASKLKAPQKKEFKATNDQDRLPPPNSPEAAPFPPKPGATPEVTSTPDSEEQRAKRFQAFKAEEDPRKNNQFPSAPYDTGPKPEDDPTKRPDHEAKLGDAMPGNELIHFMDIPDVTTPYGIPRWVPQIPSVLGSRKAEELNLEYFNHGGLPPVMIFLQGGQLAPAARDKLNSYLSGEAKNKMRGVIAEVYATGGDLTSNSTVKTSVERFGGDNLADSMFEGYDERCGGRVRSAFRLPPLFTGDTGDYTFACYDAETETLTDHGWIRHTDYRPGMRVACVDRRTGRMTFEAPSALSVYDVADVPMYHFKGAGLDVKVTPKHRMLYRKHGAWRVSPVEDMEQHPRVHFRSSVVWAEGQRLDYFDVPVPTSIQARNTAQVAPLRLPAETYLSLLGWFVSEGSVRPQMTEVTLTQKKPATLMKLRRLIAESGLSFRESLHPTTGVTSFDVKDADLAEHFASLGGKSADKALPAWVLDLPFDQLQVLFDALMAGDGSVDPREDRRNLAYYTTSARLADQVQEIALKLGYRAKLHVSPPGTYAGPEGNPTYRVLMTEAQEIEVSLTKNLQRVSYTGQVHCFTVPTGIYVTRRNGCVAVQGNTAYASYVVAEAQVFEPERELFDEKINTTIMKELAPDYVYRSLPLTVVDVAVKIQALNLAKDVTDRKTFVDEVNEVAGLNLTFQDPMTDPNNPFAAMGAMPGAGDPFAPDPSEEADGNGEGENVYQPQLQNPLRRSNPFKSPGRMRQAMGQPGSKKPAPPNFVKGDRERIAKALASDDVLTNLATDWAAHLSGERQFDPANVNFMAGMVNGMNPQVRKVFNALIGMKLAPGAKYDPDGVSDLLACAGDCLHH